jgi:hypothetical protein
MWFTGAPELPIWSLKVMLLLARTSERDRDSLEFGGSKRGWPNLTSHINTGLHGASSVILRPSLTAIVEQSLYL